MRCARDDRRHHSTRGSRFVGRADGSVRRSFAGRRLGAATLVVARDRRDRFEGGCVLRFGTLALAALALVGCSNSSPTRGSVCDDLAAAACTHAIRCEAWGGTRADCELVQRHECCGEDGTCDQAVDLDADAFEVCEATLRGATCGSNPLVSDACRSAIRPRSSPDASVGVDAGGDGVDASTAPDAGSPSRLYASCAAGRTCGSSEACYTVAYGTIDHVCSSACSDDSTCPSGHCIRMRAAASGGDLVDRTPLCLEACTTATDCTIAGWQCVATRTGAQVCVP